MYIVTIKLPRNPKHDPHNKIVGECPVSDECTDSTGEHHSTIVMTIEEVEAMQKNVHVTRVEVV